MEKAQDFFDLLEVDDVPLYKSLISKAEYLWYVLQKDKTKNPSYSLVSRKYKTTILRLINDKKRSYIRIKYFAAKEYSNEFDKALKETIEKSNFKYTGCYKCGHCVGKPVGYTIKYENGAQYFRCGRELIEVHNINEIIVEEAKKLMEIQNQYFEIEYSKKY